MDDNKYKMFAIYLEQVKDDYYDSAITLNGERVAGGVGNLSDILAKALTRVMNLHVDETLKDPFNG